MWLVRHFLEQQRRGSFSTMRRELGCGSALLAIAVAVLCVSFPRGRATMIHPAAPAAVHAREALCDSDWLHCALRTASFSSKTLRTPDGNFVNSTSNGDWTFCWDNFSMFGAHVALSAQVLETNEQYAIELLNEAQAVLEWQREHLWDWTGGNGQWEKGGFYAAALSDGSFVDTSIKYSDDNAFAGATLMESRRIVKESPLSTLEDGKWARLADEWMQMAEECAVWLTSPDSGAWFLEGGGFWWNVSTAIAPEPPAVDGLRPDNSAAIAISLFAALSSSGGHEQWLEWSEQVMQWMWSTLYDGSSGLLNWYIDQDGNINHAHFAYTNGLAAEASVLLGATTGNSTLVQRGLDLLEAVDAAFWVDDAGPSGAWIESSVVWWAVSTTLSGWVSKSAYRMSQILSGSSWAVPLQHACSNVEFVQWALRNDTLAAYFDSSTLDRSIIAFEGVYTTLNCAWGEWLTALLGSPCSSMLMHQS